MAKSDEFLEFLRSSGRIKQYMRVVACCRILGLNPAEMTVESVDQAWQLGSPGVHSKLQEEITAARNDILKWMRENPDWKQFPKF